MEVSMKQISTKEMIAMIEGDVSGTTIVSVDTITDPRMKKTNNPHLGTLKHQTLNGMVGFDYPNSNNNQLEREGKERDFKPQPRKWGVLRSNRLFVDHKDKTYLQLQITSSSSRRFMKDGVEVNEEVIKPFLPKSYAPKTQDKLDKKIIVRDVEVSNIKSIRFKGTTYLITS
jgi:hypothetical protein